MSISNKKKIKLKRELKYKVRWYDRILGPILFLFSFLILPFVIIMLFTNVKPLQHLTLKQRFQMLLNVELEILCGKIRGWKDE